MGFKPAMIWADNEQTFLRLFLSFIRKNAREKSESEKCFGELSLPEDDGQNKSYLVAKEVLA